MPSTAARALVQVAPGVHVATSRREHTTSTIVVAPDGSALIVDPAWDADELAGLAPALAGLAAHGAVGVATHRHYDHVLWDHGLPGVPRWASAESARAWTAERESLIAPLVGDLPEDLLALAGHLTPLAEPTPEVLPWPKLEVRLHAHDAHVPGHLALEIPAAAALIAGDMLSDVELPMPDPGDAGLVAYLAGLDALAPAVRRCTVLVPGHGTPTRDPMGRLDADRRYLDAVLSRRPVKDPRLALPGMRALHERTVAQAQAAPPVEGAGPGDV